MALDEMMGYNFQPGQDSGMRRTMNKSAGAAGGNMANQALRVLSLRLPNILGGRPLAAPTLMTPPTGGSGPTTNSGPLTFTGGGGAGSNTGVGTTSVSGGISASGGSGGAAPPTFTPGGLNDPGAWTGPIGGGGGSFPPPNGPGSWTGPINGGITGGGNYGSGTPTIDNTGIFDPSPGVDFNNLAYGLMRLFGRG